jgi:hypothetical protein
MAPAVGAARVAWLAWSQRRTLLWLLAILVGLPIVVAMLVVVVLTGGGGAPGQFAPSALALRDIPPAYLAAYQAAGAKQRLDWAYLAGVGKIETDHGRSRLPGVTSGANSFGAMGPMQFLAGTWASYGVDGDGDGRKDVYSPEDAIPGAARYLRASGAPADWQQALFAYNHAAWYVDEVEAMAARYRGAPVAGPTGNGSTTAIAAAADELDAMHVPYNYGGGHVDPVRPTAGQDGTFPGLDCSSSVSWVLQHAGVAVPTLTSSAFMSWGDPGRGQAVTLYTNPTHIIMSIRVDGAPERFFGTSSFGHPTAGAGPAWFTKPVSPTYLAGFVQRHPPGL